MGINTLAIRSDGEVILANFFNDFNTALGGDFVGRNSSGVPTTSQNLGTAALPWGIGRFDSLIVDGSSVDTSAFTVQQNRVISGKTLATSEMPSFLDPAGSGNGLTAILEALVSNLVLDINGASVTFSTNVNITGLTAAPSINNTCLVNDTSMSNDKYAGEDETEIIIDTAGSEITSRVGQYAAFKTATGEILFAFIKSSTLLTNAYRGFYFDDSEDPISRGNLSNNDTLTLMNIGWVFAANDGSTTDVTYETPVWSFSAPSTSTGKYWYDLDNNLWKRYSGAAWEVINRTLIGQLIMDDTDCIAARSLDFSKSFSEFNNIDIKIFTSEIARSFITGSIVSVYGSTINFGNTLVDWNITTDLDSGIVEASSTTYYLYVSEQGEEIISDVKPYTRHDLKGDYHPYQSWRFIQKVFNDSSSDLEYEVEFFTGRYFEGKRIFRRHLYTTVTITSGVLTTVFTLPTLLKILNISIIGGASGSNLWYMAPSDLASAASYVSYDESTGLVKWQMQGDSTNEQYSTVEYTY